MTDPIHEAQKRMWAKVAEDERERKRKQAVYDRITNSTIQSIKEKSMRSNAKRKAKKKHKL